MIWLETSIGSTKILLKLLQVLNTSRLPPPFPRATTNLEAGGGSFPPISSRLYLYQEIREGPPTVNQPSSLPDPVPALSLLRRNEIASQRQQVNHNYPPLDPKWLMSPSVVSA